MNTSESNLSEETFKFATAQRQRSILLYDLFCRPLSDTKPTSSDLELKLYDHKNPLPASHLSAVDSSESKFAITGLETNWGLYKGTVCIRGSDIVYIDLKVKK